MEDGYYVSNAAYSLVSCVVHIRPKTCNRCPRSFHNNYSDAIDFRMERCLQFQVRACKLMRAEGFGICHGRVVLRFIPFPPIPDLMGEGYKVSNAASSLVSCVAQAFKNR